MARLSYYIRYPSKIFSDLERWVAYRTYDKYHVVKTALKPSYYDKDTIMLEANFALLVDFVEVELGSWYDESFWKKLKRILPSFIGRPLLPHTKSSTLGLRYINDRIRLHRKPYNKKNNGPWSDKKSYDKYNAYHLNFWLEVKSLYLWWTKERPNRKDEDEVVGLDKFREKMRKKYQKNTTIYFDKLEGTVPAFKQTLLDKIKTKFFGKPPRREGLYTMKSCLNKREQAQERALYNKVFELEEKRHKEDEENLIRLMKIRRGLWT